MKNKDLTLFQLSHIDADGFGSSCVYDKMDKPSIEGKQISQTNKYFSNYDYIGEMVNRIVEDIKKNRRKEIFLNYRFKLGWN